MPTCPNYDIILRFVWIESYKSVKLSKIDTESTAMLTTSTGLIQGCFVLSLVLNFECKHTNNSVLTTKQIQSRGTTKVVGLHPVGTTNACAKCHFSSSSRCRDISVWSCKWLQTDRPAPPSTAWQRTEMTPEFSKMSSVCQGSNTVHYSASLCACVRVCADEELLGEDELDKELLWNLQLLSEVRRGSFTSPGGLQHSEKC